VEGPAAAQGVGNVFRQARARYGWTLLVYLAFIALTTIGLVLCVLPGLAVIVFLFPVTYLISATDIDFVGAFKRSYELVLQNILLVLALFGIVVALGVVIGCGGGVVNLVIGIIFGAVGAAMQSQTVIQLGTSCGAPIVNAILQLIIGYPMLCIMTGFLTAIELADSGTPIVEDDME